MTAFTTFDGRTLHVERHGPEPAALILVHGFTSNTETWRLAGIEEAILDAGVGFVSYDARGHGRSDMPHDDAAYANEAMARDLIAIIDSLGLDRVAVGAYSMGACTALRAARRDPRIVEVVAGGLGDGILAEVDVDAVANDLVREDPSSATTLLGAGLRQAVDVNNADGAALAALIRAAYGLPPLSDLTAIGGRVTFAVGKEDPFGPPHHLMSAVVESDFITLEGDHETALLDPSLASAYIDASNRASSPA